MASRDSRFVAGLVLAAGGSRRLGQPKQLLPYGTGTLLGYVLDTARACPFQQCICVLGGGSEGVRDRVDLGGLEVVENRQFGSGCSSSIAAALSAVDKRTDVLVLMLGDQAGVTVDVVTTLLAGRGDAPAAACAYLDGRGHPLAFARSMFDDLARLRGDKAVWKLLEGLGAAVVDVTVPGQIPPDIDTWEDYLRLTARA